MWLPIPLVRSDVLKMKPSDFPVCWSHVGRVLGRRSLTLAVLVCLVGVGCDSRPALPPLAPVRGTVSLDGQALTTGKVQFVPDAPPEMNAPVAVGLIGADGSYEMETQGVKGAMVGKHFVRIEANKPPRDETDTMPASLIPLYYNNHRTSGLVVEVKADVENDLPLDLVSKPPQR